MKLSVQGIPAQLSLVEFIPREASEELWAAYFAVTESIFREFNAKSRLPDRQTARRRMCVPSPFYRVNRRILFDTANTPVAVASLAYETERSPSYELDKNVCHIDIAVVRAFRRKRVAAALLRELLHTAEDLKKSTVMAEIDNPVGRKCCEAFNGELVHEEVQHRLYMEEVDWDLVGEWREKGRKKIFRYDI